MLLLLLLLRVLFSVKSFHNPGLRCSGHKAHDSTDGGGDKHDLCAVVRGEPAHKAHNLSSRCPDAPRPAWRRGRRGGGASALSREQWFYIFSMLVLLVT